MKNIGRYLGCILLVEGCMKIRQKWTWFMWITQAKAARYLTNSRFCLKKIFECLFSGSPTITTLSENWYSISVNHPHL
jgi:hypothetical protein